MTTSDLPQGRPVALVFGGRSPIAIACALQLATVQDVVLVTRRIDDEFRREVTTGSPKLALVTADLACAGAAAAVVSAIYASGREINAAVFLQRYRPDGPPRFTDHAAVELWSIEETLKAIRQQKRADTEVQALVSSSPAAEKVLVDQDLAYHVVKAGQEALVRYEAAKLAGDRIRVNAVQIGSIVIKERASTYWDSLPDVVRSLQHVAPSGGLQTSEDIGLSLARLATAGLGGATGQVITLDDGFGLRDGVQLAKTSLEYRSDRV